MNTLFKVVSAIADRMPAIIHHQRPRHASNKFYPKVNNYLTFSNEVYVLRINLTNIASYNIQLLIRAVSLKAK